MEELPDRLGDALAERFLYHFVVRKYALAVLGRTDDWGGLPLTPQPAQVAPDYGADDPRK